MLTPSVFSCLVWLWNGTLPRLPPCACPRSGPDSRSERTAEACREAAVWSLGQNSEPRCPVGPSLRALAAYAYAALFSLALFLPTGSFVRNGTTATLGTTDYLSVCVSVLYRCYCLPQELLTKNDSFVIPENREATSPSIAGQDLVIRSCKRKGASQKGPCIGESPLPFEEQAELNDTPPLSRSFLAETRPSPLCHRAVLVAIRFFRC